MVKVIIEKDGERKELTGDLAIGAAAKCSGNSVEAHAFLSGEGNVGRLVGLVSNLIPGWLKNGTNNPIEYIGAMIDLNKLLEKKIHEELKAKADDVADMLKNL